MFVPTVGPPTAKIMLVGEAPGETEDRLGKPFVGRAGKTLDLLLAHAGIIREECLITNVARERPPANQIGFYFVDSKCTIPKPILQDWINLLKEEIEKYRPNIVVALGATALWALTGSRGIKSMRGYIQESTLVPGQKMIATYHPQAVNYEWSLFFPTVLDLRKAKYHSNFPGIPEDKRVTIVDPTKVEFLEFLEELLEARLPTAVDVEAAKGFVVRVGLANRPQCGLSLSLVKGEFPQFPERDEVEIWRALSALFESVPLVFHNACYDTAILWKHHRIFPKKIHMDTMLASHVVWPELPRDLGFLASICLDVPAWKHLAKRDLGVYNAYDAMNTIALVPVLEKQLDAQGVRSVFEEEMRQIEPAVFMGLRGIEIDTKRQEALLKRAKERLAEIERELKELTGKEINYRSPQQVKQLLYVDLGLPMQFKRRKSVEEERKVTTDEEALEKLARKTKHPVPVLLLKHREQSKLISNYLSVEASPSGRIYTSYNIAGTVGARWSSSRSLIDPYGPGNLQNIPPEARVLFKASDGHVIVRGDYVQAEAVVVAFLSGDHVLMKMFRESFGMPPSLRKIKHDIHRYTASVMYGIPMDKVTKEQRQIGKILRHACNYAAGPATVAKQLNIDLREAKPLLDLYYSKNHALVAWHKRIQEQLRRDRTLVTPFGRKRRFLGRWGEELFRQAYNFIPQSTVAELLNRALADFYYCYGDKYNILLQLHDAMYVECPEDEAMEVVRLMRRTMIRPITIGQETFYIDVDFQVGKTWGEMEELDIDWREQDVRGGPEGEDQEVKPARLA